MTPSIAPILASLVNLGGPDLILPLFFAFPIWMVVDCITKESSQGNDKVVWLLVIILIPLGSFIYFFFRKLRRPPLPPAM